MEDVTPDWAFVKRMKALNKRLDIKFNGTHLVITFHTGRYGDVNIWQVVDEKGGFRQPDQRELDMLAESDLERLGPEQRWNLALAHMMGERYRQREAAREDIHDRTKDNRIQLSQAFARAAGYSKANSAFRRIERGAHEG